MFVIYNEKMKSSSSLNVIAFLYFCCFSLFSLVTSDDGSERNHNAFFIDNSQGVLSTNENIPEDVKERIQKLCVGYVNESETWESVIKENNQTILFRCCITCNKHNWKISLLSNYIKSFERNRPQTWYDDLKDGDFRCKDSYDRHIPMPLGVQRCFVHHESEVIQENGKQTYQVKNDYGTSLKSELNSSRHQCGDSVTWKPMNESYNPLTKTLGDLQCGVKVSLTSMHFFCCCYSDGKPCEVGILAARGLTCPQISMESTLKFNDGKEVVYQEDKVSSDDDEIVSAMDLKLQEECHMKISVLRESRETVLNTSISLVKADDATCSELFENIHDDQNCKTLKRHCYKDVRDELIYCCTFKFEQQEETQVNEALAKDKVLSIHSVFGKFVFNELQSNLKRLSTCLRPYSSEAKDLCVYFFEPMLILLTNNTENPFFWSNIQIDENFIVTKEMKEKIRKFENSNETYLFIRGQLNPSDPRVTDCAGLPEFYKKLPPWYSLTIAMFKCVTHENDTDRCDDFKSSRGEEMGEIAKQAYNNPHYKCNDSGTNEVVSSWDSYCFEYLYLNDSNPLGFTQNSSDGMETLLVNFNKWDNDEANGDFYCSVNERGDRVCACDAARKDACNNGNNVKNRHIIGNSPKFEASNESETCRLKNTALSPIQECVTHPEKSLNQTCVIGFLKDESSEIGCVNEPELSHGKPDHRLEKFDWHVYQICKEIFKPSETAVPYRCLIRDNLFDNYNKSSIICCCRPDTCEEAYKKAGELKVKRIKGGEPEKFRM